MATAERAVLTIESFSAALWQIQRILEEEVGDRTVLLRVYERIGAEVRIAQPAARG
jgi:hypothetical protein